MLSGTHTEGVVVQFLFLLSSNWRLNLKHSLYIYATTIDWWRQAPLRVCEKWKKDLFLKVS